MRRRISRRPGVFRMVGWVNAALTLLAVSVVTLAAAAEADAMLKLSHQGVQWTTTLHPLWTL